MSYQLQLYISTTHVVSTAIWAIITIIFNTALALLYGMHYPFLDFLSDVIGKIDFLDWRHTTRWGRKGVLRRCLTRPVLTKAVEIVSRFLWDPGLHYEKMQWQSSSGYQSSRARGFCWRGFCQRAGETRADIDIYSLHMHGHCKAPILVFLHSGISYRFVGRKNIVQAFSGLTCYINRVFGRV